MLVFVWMTQDRCTYISAHTHIHTYMHKYMCGVTLDTYHWSDEASDVSTISILGL